MPDVMSSQEQVRALADRCRRLLGLASELAEDDVCQFGAVRRAEATEDAAGFGAEGGRSRPACPCRTEPVSRLQPGRARTSLADGYA